jgi:CHAT domain-containing protein/tetratricopeptide (TPR) repeat protein
MLGRRLRHGGVLLVFLAVAASAGLLSAQTQDADEHTALYAQMGQLESQGKYAEALPVAERYVALTRQRHGEESKELATALSWLGGLHLHQGRYAEAEPVLNLALAIAEKALGPDHPTVGNSLHNLAGAYEHQGRYAEAEPLYVRALAIAEKAFGADHPAVGNSLNNLAGLYQTQSRYAAAEPLLQRSLAIAEKAVGPDDANVGYRLNNLAELYRHQGAHAKAEPLYQRSVAVLGKALGADHPDVGTALNNLAVLYEDQGRDAEAEPLHLRALSIGEKALGVDHPSVANSLNNLAHLYEKQGRYAEAEPLYQRAFAVREKALGANHAEVGMSLSNLANLYGNQRRYAEAEALYPRALAITEAALGPDHPSVATVLNNQASLYHAQGRDAEAEPLLKRALAITEKALGAEHASVGTSLNNLAEVYAALGRSEEAETLYQRGLALWEKALGPDHPSVGISLGNLGFLRFHQRDWSGGADYFRRSTAVTVRRTQRGTDDLGRTMTGQKKGEAEKARYDFWALIKTVYQIHETGTQAAREMFEAAQWSQGSEAAASLAQMAARGAKGDVGLSLLVRERQDRVAEWQRRDGARSAAVSQSPDKRDRPAEAANVTRLGEIDTRIADIDKRLAMEFPDYAALSRPQPLSVEEVQSQLHPDEALVLFLDMPAAKPTPEETFVWVITTTEMRWARSELGTPALRREVEALRCGLDAASWEGEGAAKCADLLGLAPDKARTRNAPLPFDLSRAHALYTALFGQFEDLIRAKHLLIVPSGPLSQLPFQVLVTATPAGGDYKSAAWLARQHATTVLPAVSSLKALRRVAKPSAATKAMIGFGNPLLDGDPAERPWEAEWAKLARQKQACPQTPWQHVALIERRRGAVPMTTRGGRPDLDHLRVQMPLHDTADELCAVAKDLKLPPDDIVLGARATEATIKRLSDEGRLASYRVLHFATHGTLSGEISGTSEPGLILTPPTEQSNIDDGYLSASEVAALKLDADWVILSACNTAAGGAQGAEALSGLARSFFYAGARALLVSHWSVDSAATVKLITFTVGATTRDQTLGRAEALRRAMLTMIDKGEAREAHPAFWAPFVVVGEGAAGDDMSQVTGAALPHETKAVRKPPRKIKEDWSAEFWRNQRN